MSKLNDRILMLFSKEFNEFNILMCHSIKIQHSNWYLDPWIGYSLKIQQHQIVLLCKTYESLNRCCMVMGGFSVGFESKCGRFRFFSSRRLEDLNRFARLRLLTFIWSFIACRDIRQHSLISCISSPSLVASQLAYLYPLLHEMSFKLGRITLVPNITLQIYFWNV